MMKKRMNVAGVFGMGLLAVVGGAAVMGGCAPTKVSSTTMYPGPLPTPDMIVVYDLAVSADEVKLDQGIAAKMSQSASGMSRTDQEIEIGRKLAGAMSEQLVSELRGMGFVVVRAGAMDGMGDMGGAGGSTVGMNVLRIRGQFISIDEGNQSERVWVGLGMGRSDVRALVQVYQTSAGGAGGGRVLVESFEGDAKSGFKPGMAESLGVGAVAGHVAGAAVVGGVAAVGSEAFTANVDADAKRLAKNLAKQIKGLYEAKGWSTPF